MSFWDAVSALSLVSLAFFALALLVAFAFEFINGFHDTANAVTTVIYTRTMRPTPAVLYSGVMNFLGVLLGGTGVAFGIVNLLPVDLLIAENAESARGGLVMVLALLIAGVVWNLGTWYLGLPVSSSHTLIGSILGVGLTNGLMTGLGLGGVKWEKATEVGLGLLLSPLIGFLASWLLLHIMKGIFKDPKLYAPPVGDDRPPRWVRAVLVITCGGVSFAHGSNDGQKGMGLILLVLIGFLAGHYALDIYDARKLEPARAAVPVVREKLEAAGKLTPELIADADAVTAALEGKTSFAELPEADRKQLRQRIYRLVTAADKAKLKGEGRADPPQAALKGAIEFVPLWVVIGTALALGIGTTVGYKRIVVTVAEKIGKSHLTYAQGAAAETVAALTILLSTFFKMPVSTTQVLSSGVAGTMVANGSGVQGKTTTKILLAWVVTLPCTMLLSGGLFALGRLLFQ
ncbi:MAG: inorganic phosphate transporter [Fimbriiglobus sp.]|nr:inorganic phosphate transporter [Fimbriiglobus sp.]